MSFFTDPWLYNCDNPADSPEEQAEQRTIIEATQRAVRFARRHGVTLVAALGNEHTDLGNPTIDEISPDYPLGTEKTRTVDNTCLTCRPRPRACPSAPSGRAERRPTTRTTAPSRPTSPPPAGTSATSSAPQHRRPGTSSWPRIRSTWRWRRASSTPRPGAARPVRGRRLQGRHRDTCTYWQYLQGTSMASPHAAGVAAPRGQRPRQAGLPRRAHARPGNGREGDAQDGHRHPCPNPHWSTTSTRGATPPLRPCARGRPGRTASTATAS